MRRSWPVCLFLCALLAGCATPAEGRLRPSRVWLGQMFDPEHLAAETAQLTQGIRRWVHGEFDRLPGLVDRR